MSMLISSGPGTRLASGFQKKWNCTVATRLKPSSGLGNLVLAVIGAGKTLGAEDAWGAVNRIGSVMGIDLVGMERGFIGRGVEYESLECVLPTSPRSDQVRKLFSCQVNYADNERVPPVAAIGYILSGYLHASVRDLNVMGLMSDSFCSPRENPALREWLWNNNYLTALPKSVPTRLFVSVTSSIDADDVLERLDEYFDDQNEVPSCALDERPFSNFHQVQTEEAIRCGQAAKLEFRRPYRQGRGPLNTFTWCTDLSVSSDVPTHAELHSSLLRALSDMRNEDHIMIRTWVAPPSSLQV